MDHDLTMDHGSWFTVCVKFQHEQDWDYPLGFVEYACSSWEDHCEGKTFNPSCLFEEKSFKKKKNTKKNKKDEGTTSKVLKPNGGVKKDKKDVKRTCHHCEKLGHWMRYYKEYIESVEGKKLKGASTSSKKSYDDLCFPHYLVYGTLFLLNWF